MFSIIIIVCFSCKIVCIFVSGFFIQSNLSLNHSYSSFIALKGKSLEYIDRILKAVENTFGEG